eukprot:CAMPEP_0197908128 /NCGR_PEP_ID=MMETSP1439-20131203/66193_1 /TAXON_ID=66791 /ORGANISM="Gonyaulax spinifera, Strain CCMP409" /LENGTH=45 /DNA_ID= /DNA_START= /DNA_END= /DNA_ORIENTATION=
MRGCADAPRLPCVHTGQAWCAPGPSGSPRLPTALRAKDPALGILW